MIDRDLQAELVTNIVHDAMVQCGLNVERIGENTLILSVLPGQHQTFAIDVVSSSADA